ncbi:hypothetical protein VNI00_016656 [Paramarasmius palmivorus]|uniref:Uncharacterized protein n=1 Tax=Paramarasmius palmivorus TaxID=297713 RepID=A0AAW0BBQ5_9AGAR
MPKLSPADAAFVDLLKPSVLDGFRKTIFNDSYVNANPEWFSGYDWIDIVALKRYLDIPQTREIVSTDLSIKTEEIVTNLHNISTAASSSLAAPQLAIKVEPNEGVVRVPASSNEVKLVTHIENGREVFELLSEDSEEEGAVSAKGAASMKDSPHSNSELVWVESNTYWEDEGQHSGICTGRTSFSITTETRVQHLERLRFLPSLWPIPQTPTAFLLDLTDSPCDIKGKDGELINLDNLIKNHDNDSWTSYTGVSDSKVKVQFEPGQPSVQCRRARLYCNGVYACSRVPSNVVNVTRYDLDLSQRDAILRLEDQNRAGEGGTKESAAAIFLNVVHSKKCSAVDEAGNHCDGQQIVKQFEDESLSHQYIMICSRSTSSYSSSGHLYHFIPAIVDAETLIKIANDHRVSDGSSKDTPPCGRVVSPRVGARKKHCDRTHISNGVVESKSPMVVQKCKAMRTIFVPLDSSIRKAIIVHGKNNTPHSHPIPVLEKATYTVQEAYASVVRAHGVLGATVQKVDNASSTSILLDGKMPAEFSPALQNKRAKREIIRKEKLNVHSQGLGIPGVVDLQVRDQNKPVEERYVHRVSLDDSGGVLIFTCYTRLLKLIHEVTSFEGDTAFKRLRDLNEWEMVIYYKKLTRAVTIMRVYLNRASTEHFTLMFDGVRNLVLNLTGRPMAFKRFQKDGNLLCMNTDMEAAQVLGAGASFLKTNDPSYSGITTVDASIFVQYFVKLCLVHVKRGINDFRSQLSSQDYEHLISFMTHIKSQLDLLKFDEWIRHHNNKKLTGEGQHHWSNDLTDTQLTIVEGIEKARNIDLKVIQELEIAEKTGVLTNPHNGLHQRLSRNIKRQTKAVEKSREATAQATTISRLQETIEKEKHMEKEAKARRKELEEQLKSARQGSGQSRRSGSLQGSLKVSGRKTTKSTSSSSGRVKVSNDAVTDSRPDDANFTLNSEDTSGVDGFVSDIVHNHDSDEPDSASVVGNFNIFEGLALDTTLIETQGLGENFDQFDQSFLDVPLASSSFASVQDSLDQGQVTVGSMPEEYDSERLLDSGFVWPDNHTGQVGLGELGADFYNLPDATVSTSSLFSNGSMENLVGSHYSESRSLSDFQMEPLPSDSEYLSEGGYSDAFSHSSGFDGAGYSGLDSYSMDDLSFMHVAGNTSSILNSTTTSFQEPIQQSLSPFHDLLDIPSPPSSPNRFDERLPVPPSPLSEHDAGMEPYHGVKETKKRRRTGDALALDEAQVIEGTRARKRTNKSLGISGVCDNE